MKKGTAAALALLLVLAAGGGGWWFWTKGERDKDAAAKAALTAFAQGYQQRRLSGAGLAFARADDAAAFDKAVAPMQSAQLTSRLGEVDRNGSTATGTLDVSWDVGADKPWAYSIPVSAKAVGDKWVIQPPAEGTYLSPDMYPGQTVQAKRTPGTRGDLLDAAGKPLMPAGFVYPVAIDPTRATAEGMAELEKVTEEPAGSLKARLAAAKKSGSQAPIPVITYREADFAKRKKALDGIVGVVYPEREQPLGKTREFGQPLLGSFGDVTAELVKESKGRYAAGDRAGTSGLQRRYDERLAGSPGVSVETSTGKQLFTQAAVDGQDVTTTLDVATQDAAQAAVATTGDVPSALVAIDVKSGAVKAVANNPALGMNRAVSGRFPPGSTLKVATTYALLTQGLVTPTTPVPCPATTVVDGRSFKNFEGDAGGAATTFADDFHDSCNTAFVSLAAKLPDDGISKASAALGVTGDWAASLGVGEAFSGSVPASNGATDKAAGAIGQGRDLASPLAMAVMAGNVARGSVIAPSLVTDPAPKAAPKGEPLDAEAVATLRTLMRGVVTSGSGTALKDAPGGEVFGKSGTAEFGEADPPETHAWFVGWQGETAFAVLVEKGRSGGSVAAPVAKEFLTQLAAG
ncbi:penicillin-binding transpeptidase domain-containing protein [Actinomycetota bacterium]